jgi:hypothetical protein
MTSMRGMISMRAFFLPSSDLDPPPPAIKKRD